MARILNSLLSRLVLSALAIHIILAPLLYAQLARITYESETELFINDVRAYSRFLADLLELQMDRLSRSQLHDLLDTVVLSRDTAYASVRGPELTVSSMLTDISRVNYIEDFTFGEHDDDTYFISAPLETERYEEITLQLGFDERPTAAILAASRQRIVVALAIFLGASLLFAALLGLFISRPLRQLQRASQTVAKGRLGEKFSVGSHVLEIRELATDMDNMRTHLVRANDRLRKEVRERSEVEHRRAQLESTLRHVQKLETIGTLAGGIAHEFNNVLQPMKFYTELAMDETPRNSAVHADLQNVLKSIGRAKDIVQQILTFSRRSQEEQFVVLDVGPVVRDVVSLARGLFPATVDIGYSIDPECPTVLGDVTQIYQLLMNLCSNAYQAMDANGGSIRIDVSETVIVAGAIPNRTDLEPGEYVGIDVIDDGQGIDPMTLERVFEPFFTRRIPGEGTGLGLSVAHGIATAHGGSITARSELGMGTTLSVFLPVAARHIADKPTPRDRTRRVTYVGTESNIRENGAVIEDSGFFPVCVSNGDELETLLESAAERDDIVIVDLGESEQWIRFVETDWHNSFMDPSRVLVVVPIGAVAHHNHRVWSGVKQIVGPVSYYDLKSAVRRLLKESSLIHSGGVG